MVDFGCKYCSQPLEQAKKGFLEPDVNRISHSRFLARVIKASFVTTLNKVTFYDFWRSHCK